MEKNVAESSVKISCINNQRCGVNKSTEQWENTESLVGYWTKIKYIQKFAALR
jgi:hypothetical protein